MQFDIIMNFLKTYRMPGEGPNTIFLLPEAAMADIYEFIIAHKLRSCIELGTGHGATACIMAAAVMAQGGGRVLTIDRHLVEPASVQALKTHAGLGSVLDVVIEPLGYNWYLADEIMRQTIDGTVIPLFDFCLLDGAHEWEPDALAFLLAAKLVRPGGWIVLDDINFKLRDMPHWAQSHGHLSDRELDSFQMRMVYDLIVCQHPEFHNFRVTHDGRIGWAQKRPLEAHPSRERAPKMAHLHPQWRRLMSRAHTVYREEGAAAVVRRAAAYLKGGR